MPASTRGLRPKPRRRPSSSASFSLTSNQLTSFMVTPTKQMPDSTHFSGPTLSSHLSGAAAPACSPCLHSVPTVPQQPGGPFRDVNEPSPLPCWTSSQFPRDPTIPRLGMYPKELKAGSLRYVCSIVTEALFTTAERWKRPACPRMEDKQTRCGLSIYWDNSQP